MPKPPARVRTFDPRPDPRGHISANPGLFDQKQVKPNNENRYQRGFTPQRMQRVRQALSHEAGPQEGRLRVGGRPDLRAHFVETVARSSMPMAPLQHMGSAEASSGELIDATGLRRPDVLGRTTATQSRLGLTPSVDFGSARVGIFHGAAPYSTVNNLAHRSVANREMMSGTVMHELGHVAHQYTEPVEYGFQASGTRERKADRFMIKHYRPDPREVRRGSQLDPERFTYPVTTPSSPKMEGYRGWDKEQANVITDLLVHQRRNRPQSQQPSMF